MPMSEIGLSGCIRIRRAHAALGKVRRRPGERPDRRSLCHQFLVFDAVGGRIASLRLFPRLVFAVRAFVIDHLRVALEREDVRGDTVEEPAVVRNHDSAAGEILEALLQRTQRVDIDVVGRLVQQ